MGFDGMTTMPLAAYGNIVYSYHAYDPHQFTGQGVEYAYEHNYPNNSLACFPGGINLNWNASTLGPQGFNCNGSGRQTLLDLQAQYHFPIFVGEFSAYTASPFNDNGKPSATQWVDDIIAYFESKGFSWAYHSWREWWGWDAEVDQAEAVRLRNGGSYPINRNSNSPTIQVLKNYFKMNTGGPNVPVNTAVPTISGTAQVGQTLTANDGTWTNSPTSFSITWSWEDFGNSTFHDQTFAVRQADVGHKLGITVIATNGSGSSAPVRSALTSPVTQAQPVPVNTAVPSISGTGR
jgi:hypothetical protein